jgi:sn-glycerol 3-phosphate transport system substrate-binding protein
MAGKTFDKSQYLPGIVAYYSKPDGTMLSFPYNSSSPILYYNKDIFEKAGLDPKPAQDLGRGVRGARQIKESGAAPCGYTSTWLTWITSRTSRPGTTSWASNENGLAGDARAEDQRRRRSSSSTSRRSPTWPRTAPSSMAAAPRKPSRSSSGECGILTESSGGLGDIVKSGMNYGIGQLPYDETAEGAPQNTIPGGASALGDGRQVGRDLQGRRGLLQLPVADRGAAVPARTVGLPAGDDGGL